MNVFMMPSARQVRLRNKPETTRKSSYLLFISSSNKKLLNMSSPIQLTLILATILLVALSVSATKTNNKLTATRSKSSDGKPTDLSTSPSMSNNQMVPMSMIPKQQLASNVYQSQSYLSPVRSGPISQSPSQVSMQTSASHHQAGDLSAAAGHHHKHHQPHGKYYEYREVPHKKAWKFGYKRGNHKHTSKFRSSLLNSTIYDQS